MYILVNKNTNKVFQVSENKPISYSDNLILCEVDFIPLSYDYLITENIHGVIETWEEVVEDYDDNGNVVAKTEEMSRTYNTCDLIPMFRPQPSQEFLDQAKEYKIDNLAKKYIREKYELEDELKIHRRVVAYPDNTNYRLDFLEYNTYVEKCILKAKEEIK